MERRAINPWTWQDEFGYVQANEVKAGDRVLYCSGQTSVDPDGNPLHEGDMAAQLAQALDNLETVLTDADYGLADVVRMNIYVTDLDAFFAAYGPVAGRMAQAGMRPASTLLTVSQLAFPGLMVELEATAVA